MTTTHALLIASSLITVSAVGAFVMWGITHRCLRICHGDFMRAMDALCAAMEFVRLWRKGANAEQLEAEFEKMMEVCDRPILHNEK